MECSFSALCIARYIESSDSLRNQLEFITAQSPEGVKQVDALMHNIQRRCDQISSDSWNDTISEMVNIAHMKASMNKKTHESSVEYNDWFQFRWEVIEELTRNINDDEIAEDALTSMLEFLIELQDKQCCIEDQIFEGGVENFVRFLNNTTEYCMQQKIYQKHRALIHASVASLRFMYEGRTEPNIERALKEIEDIC